MDNFVAAVEIAWANRNNELDPRLEEGQVFNGCGEIVTL